MKLFLNLFHSIALKVVLSTLPLSSAWVVGKLQKPQKENGNHWALDWLVFIRVIGTKLVVLMKKRLTRNGAERTGTSWKESFILEWNMIDCDIQIFFIIFIVKRACGMMNNWELYLLSGGKVKLLINQIELYFIKKETIVLTFERVKFGKIISNLNCPNPNLFL